MLRTLALAAVVLIPLTAQAGNSDYGGYGSYGRSSQSGGSTPSGGSTAPTDQYGRTSGGWLGAIGDFFRDLYDAWNGGERQNAPPSDCISCGTRGDVDPALITRQYGAPVA